MSRLFSTALCLFLFPLFAFADDTVLVTLKLVKTSSAPANVPVAIEFPAACKTCQEVHDSDYARQNNREVILAMRIPRSTPVDLLVKTEGSAFRRVTLETTDLKFESTLNDLHFTLPS